MSREVVEFKDLTSKYSHTKGPGCLCLYRKYQSRAWLLHFRKLSIFCLLFWKQKVVDYFPKSKIMSSRWLERCYFQNSWFKTIRTKNIQVLDMKKNHMSWPKITIHKSDYRGDSPSHTSTKIQIVTDDELIYTRGAYCFWKLNCPFRKTSGGLKKWKVEGFKVGAQEGGWRRSMNNNNNTLFCSWHVPPMQCEKWSQIVSCAEEWR